jgi:NLI interacting factor-like phosphatase
VIVFVTKKGSLKSRSIYIKDLLPFLEVDPFLRKTIVIDRVFHTCALDLLNLCPIMPFYGDPTDKELSRLCDLLKSISKSEDFKKEISRIFGIRRAIGCETVEGMVKCLFL